METRSAVSSRGRESDWPIVLMKPPKETRRVEGRGWPETGRREEAIVRTQRRGAMPPNLVRVHEAATRDKRTKFTALLHHVDVEALARAFRRLKRWAAAGVDGETVATYEQDLEAKLKDLHERVRDGSYRSLPVRRVHIPKADGGRRPLGIPALEDKIVQGAWPSFSAPSTKSTSWGSRMDSGRAGVHTGPCSRCTPP
jgi:RNA-directed DNA polymerase